MKKWSLWIAFIGLILSNVVSANIYDDNMVSTSWDTDDSSDLQDTVIEQGQSFFTLEGDYEHIFKSNFRESEFNHQKIAFSEGGVNISYAEFVTCYEALSGGFGYSNTNIDWHENPYFDTRNFNNFNLNLNAVCKRFGGWDFKGGVTASIDAREWDLANYTLYNMIFWGRYNWNNCSYPDLRLHFGAVGWTGLKKTYAVPIIGFDATIWKNLHLNLVYPVNLSLVYALCDNWSIDLTGKIWRSRHKLPKDEPDSRGYFEYRNTGLELGLNYECGQFLSANIHAGSTLGAGDLKISNSHNDTLQHCKFKSAPYVGGELVVRF